MLGPKYWYNIIIILMKDDYLNINITSETAHTLRYQNVHESRELVTSTTHHVYKMCNVVHG